MSTELYVGQIVKWKLKDGTEVEGTVASFDSSGVVLFDVTQKNVDGTASSVRVKSIALSDVVTEHEEEPTSQLLEGAPVDEAPRRRGRPRKARK